MHGCTYFDNDDGTKVIKFTVIGVVTIFQTFLVAGHGDGNGYASSTELLQENSSAWVFSGELPFRTWGLEMANIDGRVISTGSLQEKFSRYHF